MEKKSFVKLLLVLVVTIGLVFLVVSQFNRVGTSEGSIDYYNLDKEITSKVDSLPSAWNSTSYNSIREVLSDIDIAKGMSALDSLQADNAQTKVKDIFSTASTSYFTHSIWNERDLEHIKSIASFLRDNKVSSIIDGYYGAKNIIASSRSCATQSAVENCISKAATYNKAPWTHCTEIKDGLSSVKKAALDSYTSRNLIPLCNKLVDFKKNYTYFDDFDRDYQIATSGKSFLTKMDYNN
jgi:hypothetical protein